MKNSRVSKYTLKSANKIQVSIQKLANQTLFVFKSYNGVVERVHGAEESRLVFKLVRRSSLRLYTCTPPPFVCTVYIPHSSTSGPDTGKVLSPPCFEYYVPDRSKCSRSFCLCNTSSPTCREKICSSDKSSESHRCR